MSVNDEPIPENAIPATALDYVIIPKDEAIALADWMNNQYIHYDNELVKAAADRVHRFRERHGEHKDNG